MSTIDCTLSPARPEDAQRISMLSARLIEAGLPRSWDTRRVVWFIRNRDSVVLTARMQDRLVGFAIMRFSEDTAHLNLLGVEPSYQRRGIGRRLLAWLEETAVVAGTFMISLEVRADNQGAIEFYQALGYIETGSIAGYYDGTIDATLLARDLRFSDAGSFPG